MVALLPQELMIFYVTLRKNSFLTQIITSWTSSGFLRETTWNKAKKYVIITTLQPASSASSGSVSHSDHSSWTAKLRSTQERKDPLKRPASRHELSLPHSQLPRSQKHERPRQGLERQARLKPQVSACAARRDQQRSPPPPKGTES